MNQDEIIALRNVLKNYDFGKDVVFTLLRQLGAFERGHNRNCTDREFYMTLGRREKGLWLLDCVYKADPQIYAELIARSKK